MGIAQCNFLSQITKSHILSHRVFTERVTQNVLGVMQHGQNSHAVQPGELLCIEIHVEQPLRVPGHRDFYAWYTGW